MRSRTKERKETECKQKEKTQKRRWRKKIRKHEIKTRGKNQRRVHTNMKQK